MIDCEGNRPIHSAAAANAAASNIIGFGSCFVQQEQQNTSNQLLQFCLGHSSTLIHFTLLHTCSVCLFSVSPPDYLVVVKLLRRRGAWRATRCCVIALFVASGFWSPVLDWFTAVSWRGNLISAGHPGLPPLARGLYPEQGHRGRGLKNTADFICNLSWGHTEVRNVSLIWYIASHQQADGTVWFTAACVITVKASCQSR